MARTIPNRPGGLPYSSSSIEPIVEIVRAVWQRVDDSGVADQAALKREIFDAVQRLKDRIERKLRMATPVTPVPEPLLFVVSPKERRSTQPLFEIFETPPRFPEPKVRVYAKDLASHALKHVPKLSGCQSIEDVRKYLITNLRFNSEATRRRNANYLISRFFPGEVVHHDVPTFAAAAEGKQALGEALFYLTGRTEKIVSLVAEEVVFPSLTEGGVSRTRIRDYVQARLPNSKSASEVGSAIVATYQTYGIGSASGTRLNVVLREGCLASFRLHSSPGVSRAGNARLREDVRRSDAQVATLGPAVDGSAALRLAGRRACCPRSVRSTGCVSSPPSTRWPMPCSAS